MKLFKSKFFSQADVLSWAEEKNVTVKSKIEIEHDETILYWTAISQYDEIWN